MYPHTVWMKLFNQKQAKLSLVKFADSWQVVNFFQGAYRMIFLKVYFRISPGLGGKLINLYFSLA